MIISNNSSIQSSPQSPPCLLELHRTGDLLNKGADVHSEGVFNIFNQISEDAQSHLTVFDHIHQLSGQVRQLFHVLLSHLGHVFPVVGFYSKGHKCELFDLFRFFCLFQI
jgi:hypothetical protein